MFEKHYKSAMDKVVPTEDALNKTLSAMKGEASPVKRRKQIIRRSVICAAAFALIFSSVFAAFRIAKTPDTVEYSDGKDSFEGYGKMIGLRAAGSEKEIENAIDEYKSSLNRHLNHLYYGGLFSDQVEFAGIPEADNIINAGVETDDTPLTEKPAEAPGAPDHSDTNNQVSGVQEADIVKNDGRYIYFCSAENGTLYITEAKDGKMTGLSETKVADEYSRIKEMLLIGNKLAVIFQSNNSENSNYDTTCVFFDISDRAAPKLVNKSSQSGSYVSSRAIGDYVYIISNYSNYDSKALPEINCEAIDAECTYLPDKLSGTSFTVVTSYNAGSDGCENTDAISILSVSGVLYSGKENLYLTATQYIDRESDQLQKDQKVPMSKTDIYRIELNNGKMKPTAFGNVPGTLKDQFSIDESGDVLRIATNIEYATVVRRTVDSLDDILNSLTEKYTFETSWEDRCNKVFCLDGNLDIIGESAPLGISEQIKSVRYLGDIAYVVTFRQTDPLYAVDISDPKNPKGLSALKIDGFSTYMHPYGDGLLLGIGYDTTKTGRTKGLKLTMFDVSDPKNVFAVSNCILSWDDGYSNSTALYNHKATLIDAKKNIIAIPITENKNNVIVDTVINEDGSKYIDTHIDYVTNTYFVFFEFDGKTLTEQKRITVCEEDLSSDIRGLYIGNYGYLTHNGGIISIDLSTFETVETLVYGK